MTTQKTTIKTVRVLFATLVLSTIFGCGSSKEVDKIGDAQQCLNVATSATAMDCVTKVDGITSTGAYNIRCAAAFVREGFTNPAKYTNAFSSLNGGGSANFMSLVSFSSAGTINTDAVNASTTFSDCYSAGAKGKSLISAFGFFSTALMKFFADSCPSVNSCKTPTTSGYNLTTCMTDSANALCTASLSLVDTSASSAAATVQSSIGSVIISTYNISCSGSSANKELCNTLKASITAGGSDPRAVFRSFFSTSVK